MLKRTDIKQNILYRLESLACCLNACSTLQDWSILSGLAHPSNRYFDYKLDSNLMYCRIHCWEHHPEMGKFRVYALHAKWTDFWHSIFMLQCIKHSQSSCKSDLHVLLYDCPKSISCPGQSHLRRSDRRQWFNPCHWLLRTASTVSFLQRRSCRLGKCTLHAFCFAGTSARTLKSL